MLEIATASKPCGYRRGVYDPPEFHDGARPLKADLQARASFSPGRISLCAVLEGRFPGRQISSKCVPQPVVQFLKGPLILAWPADA